jgi:tetratricopeptide (TPR) repeat protein
MTSTSIREKQSIAVQESQIRATIAQYSQLLLNKPDIPEIHANLGSLYAQQEKWHKAIACYEQAIALNPEFAGAYRNLARVLTQIGNQKKAANCWFKAFKLEPDCVKAEEHYHLGNTLWSQKKLVKAATCYTQAIKLKPDLIAAYQNLGKLLTSQGKEQQAIALYRQGIKQNPQNLQLHLHLGQALAIQEKWESAKLHYQQAIKLNSDCASAYYALGTICRQQQQLSAAIDYYQQAIQLQPSSWEVYYQLGNVLQQTEKWSEAIVAYQESKKINPNFIPTYLQLGSIFFKNRNYPKAIDNYHCAVKQTSKSSQLEQQAIAAYQQALAANPATTSHHYYQLAKLLRSKGYFVQAIAAYQQAIELNPRFGNAYIDLQYIPIAPQQREHLVKFYQHIVEKYPNIPIAWGNLGDSLTQQGKITEAINCYQTSSYQKTIIVYPQLAELEWNKKKENGPDFIIIGASKCGTSSLYNYLSYHPQILFSHKKELDFFWKNFDRGINWYLAHFPTLSDRDDFLTGEATPNYLRFPIVAERIKEYCSQVKLIVLLRNPVERAISWHYHKIAHGLTSGSLTDAIAQEMKELESWSETDFFNTGYRNPDNLLSSLYCYQFKVWLELFSQEQFLILKSEDLYNHPASVMEQVYGFLGLSNHQLSEYPQVNAGSYNSVDPQLRKTLANYFRPYNQQLQDYLGMQFNWD